MLHTHRINSSDELDEIVRQINAASWDDANQMAVYDVASLRAYLTRQDTIFIACYNDTDTGSTLMGIASSRLEQKPYGQELWLYVDEVDVCADQRGQGAGKHMMNTLIDLAHTLGCEELWLGTEVDNIAANALYRSLDPDDVESVVGYTFETDD